MEPCCWSSPGMQPTNGGLTLFGQTGDLRGDRLRLKHDFLCTRKNKLAARHAPVSTRLLQMECPLQMKYPMRLLQMKYPTRHCTMHACARLQFSLDNWLTTSPQTRLNIPDMPMGGFVAAGGAGPAAAAPAAEEEEAAPAAAEKTLFNLKLEKFDAGSKPKVIKEIKSMLGLSLVDSKKFVESAPKMMKEGVPKEEAEKIVETLKALGATAIME